MTKTLYNILIFVIFVGFTACEALEDFSETTPEEKVPIVVEGILMPQFEPVVWLSELSGTSDVADTNYVPVNNAQVTLYYNGKAYKLSLYDAEWGEYSYQGDDLKIIAGDNYSLEVEYLDRTVSAETDIPYPVKNISVKENTVSTRDSSNSELYISWESSDDSYFYLTFEGDTSNVSELACYYSEYPFAETNFTIDASGLYEGDTYYIIIYSLQQNYAQYYFGYDPLNSNYNYESNISDGYGIFTGLNVNYISFQYQKDLNIKLQAQRAPEYLYKDIFKMLKKLPGSAN